MLKVKKSNRKKTGLYMTLLLLLPDELQDPQHQVIEPILRHLPEEPTDGTGEEIHVVLLVLVSFRWPLCDRTHRAAHPQRSPPPLGSESAGGLALPDRGCHVRHRRQRPRSGLLLGPPWLGWLFGDRRAVAPPDGDGRRRMSCGFREGHQLLVWGFVVWRGGVVRRLQPRDTKERLVQHTRTSAM